MSIEHYEFNKSRMNLNELYKHFFVSVKNRDIKLSKHLYRRILKEERSEDVSFLFNKLSALYESRTLRHSDIRGVKEKVIKLILNGHY